jgi:predicted flavoprotein YhiN
VKHEFDVIILGGGAAGLMCAVEAGKRGTRVVVLERARRIGKKILISGGGRCNFTNLHCQPENFISNNPHFAKSALAAYTPADFIALVEKHGIAYHEKTLGQLFCDGSAQAMRVTEMGASEGCPVIGQIEVASPRGDKNHLAGNGADFLLMLSSRTLEKAMHEAKQMTMA